MFEKIDKTIEAVCDRVQRKSKEGAFEDMELPDLVSALAELISAREEIMTEKKIALDSTVISQVVQKATHDKCEECPR